MLSLGEKKKKILHRHRRGFRIKDLLIQNKRFVNWLLNYFYDNIRTYCTSCFYIVRNHIVKNKEQECLTTSTDKP